MIKYVEIYKLAPQGKKRKVGTCSLLPKTSRVKCEGEDWLIKVLSEGINDYLGRGGKCFPRDGLRFLQNLRFHFRSGYLGATDIKSKG